MSVGKKFWVLDHRGVVTAHFGEAEPAVELAKEYAKRDGVADVLHGNKRKRFLASGKVYTVREATP